MSPLAEMQAGLRALIKNRQSVLPADPYLKAVEESKGLVMIREIAVWWRGLQLENYCFFTGRLLKRLGIFDETVRQFFFQESVSPYVETASDLFLARLSTDANSLIMAMAQFERAVARVKQGDLSEYHVIWDRNPDAVFQSLTSGEALPAEEPGTKYEMKISRGIPGLVSCVREACC